MAENGNGKFYQEKFFVGLMACVLATFGWTTFCFFYNGNRIADLSATVNHSLVSINENMSAINIRLSRIEWKLEGK